MVGMPRLQHLSCSVHSHKQRENVYLNIYSQLIFSSFIQGNHLRNVDFLQRLAFMSIFLNKSRSLLFSMVSFSSLAASTELVKYNPDLPNLVHLLLFCCYASSLYLPSSPLPFFYPTLSFPLLFFSIFEYLPIYLQSHMNDFAQINSIQKLTCHSKL